MSDKDDLTRLSRLLGSLTDAIAETFSVEREDMAGALAALAAGYACNSDEDLPLETLKPILDRYTHALVDVQDAVEALEADARAAREGAA